MTSFPSDVMQLILRDFRWLDHISVGVSCILCRIVAPLFRMELLGLLHNKVYLKDLMCLDLDLPALLLLVLSLLTSKKKEMSFFLHKAHISLFPCLFEAHSIPRKPGDAG